MIRKAFVMSIRSGKEDEYRHRHDPIWPELEQVLKDHGTHNYSIFFHPETLQLFAYVEIDDESRWASIAQTEVCKRWWASMKELMPSHLDDSPISQPLYEVFHLL